MLCLKIYVTGDIAVVRSADVRDNGYSEEFSRTELIRNHDNVNHARESTAAIFGLPPGPLDDPHGPYADEPWMTGDPGLL